MSIDVGLAIRTAQLKVGLSSMKMAEDFGVVKQQIHRWRYSKDMKLSKAVEFANYFGYSLCDFVELGKQ